MVLRKPSALFTKDVLPFLTWGTPSFATLPTPLSPACTRLQQQRRLRERHRRYATLTDATYVTSDDALPWPKTPNSRLPPSPYQIFNQERGSPYSKRRFYELVMKYHPDRNSHPDDSANTPNPCKCPREVMLERYRLVVAANTILSDPEKRAAYDNFGFGWDADLNSPGGSPLHKYSTYHRWRKTSDPGFKWPTDQDPMYNATWEDWERWYTSQADRARASSTMPLYGNFFTARHGKQSPGVFMSNYAFLSIVFLFALLGGIGQATRVSDVSKSRMERAQQLNDETSQVLMRARQDALDSAGAESKRERIQRFIASVEGSSYEPEEFEPRALRPGVDDDVCASGAVKDRDQPRYWEKPPENK